MSRRDEVREDGAHREGSTSPRAIYAGGRPVCEIEFCDYGFNTIGTCSRSPANCWAWARARGHFEMPMVLMTPSGSGIRGSLYHSHSFESWASRLAGWKIVMPSNPLDAYGLMLSAIADPNPVMVLLPKAACCDSMAIGPFPGEPPDEHMLQRNDRCAGRRPQPLATALARRQGIFRCRWVKRRSRAKERMRPW